MDISIVIPAYNEEAGIGETLQSLQGEPRLHDAEIIVINDGSTDQTRATVEQYPAVRLINHPTNRGYGASIVSGIKLATKPYVIWFDSDGQHRVIDLLLVADTLLTEPYDYCIGVRDHRSKAVMNRKLGKWILKQTVQFVAHRKIADYNSGLRGFKRDVISRYLHLLPSGFSASTTTSLIMYDRGYVGTEVPIIVQERLGKSSVNQFRDGFRTLVTVLRILMLFRPMSFFGALGVFFVVVGMIYSINEAIQFGRGFPVFGALIVILGLQSFFFGLLADQVSAMRREKFE